MVILNGDGMVSRAFFFWYLILNDGFIEQNIPHSSSTVIFNGYGIVSLSFFFGYLILNGER
jgi:hypothetical protein